MDEFSKVDPRLYNMFYQLFDEGRYVDMNYDVDMRNALSPNLKLQFRSISLSDDGSCHVRRASVSVHFCDLM